MALLLLLFVLGLPRMLVFCSHGDHGHVELAHAAGCCQHGHDVARPSPDRGTDERVPLARSHCEHVQFAWELGTPPRPFELAPLAVGTFATAAMPEFLPRLAECASHHAPATGPPRLDERTELLRSTNLRI